MIGFWLVLSGVSVASAEVVAKFSGSGPAKTESFRVEVPWVLSWRAESDFATLANLEIQLYDANTGEFAGIVDQHVGIGRGRKLIRESGRYRLGVLGCCVDWNITIEKADDTLLEAVEDNDAISELRLFEPDNGLPREVVERISAWEAGPGENELTLRTKDGGIFRVTFQPACHGLESTEGINFVTSRKRYHQFTSILLDDGTRCYLDRIQAF
jgi:hypothetical protein